MDSGDIRVNESWCPCSFLDRVGTRVFHPKRMAISECTGPVQIAVSIDVNNLTVDTTTVATFESMKNDLTFPVWSQKEAYSAVKTGNDIEKVVSICI